MKDEVTFIITSCGRLDLLFRTIDSFLEFNSYPITEMILIEDSGDRKNLTKIQNKYGSKFKYIFNEKNIGFISSISKIYSEVKTDYVFHCEDDWEFYRAGFIEDSFKLLKNQPKISFISLRDIYHEYRVYNPEGSFGEIEQIENIRYRKLYYKTINVAYSANPHLFKFNDDIKNLLPFENWAKYESDIQSRLLELGYYGVVLENSACAHIGWGASLFNQRRKKTDVKLKNLAKAILNLLGQDFTFEQ